MTKIKLCGLSRTEDIEAANTLLPEYIGFVFAENSRRYVTPEKAKKLKAKLVPCVLAVGVFINEAPEIIAELLNNGVIDLAQLHGSEGEAYIAHLRTLTDRPIIAAYQIKSRKNCNSNERKKCI